MSGIILTAKKIKMIPTKYAYISGCLIFLSIWALLFWHRKDLRREMLVMSLIFAFGSLLSAHFWLRDWWRPATITGTSVGIEDFILGFSNGGIATVLYAEIFRKKLYKVRGEHLLHLIAFSLISYGVFYVSIYQFQSSSFAACILTILLYSGLMLYLRRNLFLSCLASGFLMLMVAAPVYFILKLMSPGALNYTYIFKMYPDIHLFGIPVQEFIFYFFFGFMVPLVYEYWHGLEIRSLPTYKSHRKRSGARA